jgi:hypothetical protein
LRADLSNRFKLDAHNLPGARMGDEIIRSSDLDPALCLLASVELAEGVAMRIYGSAVGCPMHQVDALIRSIGLFARGDNLCRAGHDLEDQRAGKTGCETRGRETSVVVPCFNEAGNIEQLHAPDESLPRGQRRL